jgi:hypothetical protein
VNLARDSSTGMFESENGGLLRDYPEKDNLNREDYDTPSNYGGALFSGKPMHMFFVCSFGERRCYCVKMKLSSGWGVAFGLPESRSTNLQK